MGNVLLIITSADAFMMIFPSLSASLIRSEHARSIHPDRIDALYCVFGLGAAGWPGGGAGCSWRRGRSTQGLAWGCLDSNVSPSKGSPKCSWQQSPGMPQFRAKRPLPAIFAAKSMNCSFPPFRQSWCQILSCAFSGNETLCYPSRWWQTATRF